ncbi:MAG: hypothetical protein QOI02_657 [Actinomycetota bacterium]|nr:hypothetical protein [Actinomycetota bacterium]
MEGEPKRRDTAADLLADWRGAARDTVAARNAAEVADAALQAATAAEEAVREVESAAEAAALAAERARQATKRALQAAERAGAAAKGGHLRRGGRPGSNCGRRRPCRGNRASRE